jgi:hypothetical protein
MEDSPRLRRAAARCRVPALAWGALWTALSVLAVGAAGAAGDDPVAEIAEAIRALGPPGVLWGRVAVEEESPEGPWTPLRGVEVTLYPATPSIQAELERIRRSARDSGAQYESAVARVRAALAAHQGLIDAQSAGTPLARPAPAAASPAAPPPTTTPPTSRASGGTAPPPSPGAAAARVPPPSRSALDSRRDRFGRGPLWPRDAPPAKAAEPTAPPEPPHPFRQSTDSSGLFAFEAVPSGDWLLVAIHLAPYSGERLVAAKPRSPKPGQYFLPRATGGPAKEAEIWVVPVRVQEGQRVGLELTDRARWLVGPLR